MEKWIVEPAAEDRSLRDVEIQNGTIPRKPLIPKIICSTLYISDCWKKFLSKGKKNRKSSFNQNRTLTLHEGHWINPQIGHKPSNAEIFIERPLWRFT